MRDIADLGGGTPTSVLEPDCPVRRRVLDPTHLGNDRTSESGGAVASCGPELRTRLGARDRVASGRNWLSPLPLQHVGGSVTGALTALAIGATYFVVDRFSPHTVLGALRAAGRAAPEGLRQPALLLLVGRQLGEIACHEDQII